MEIKSNVLGKLKKMRDGSSFSDSLSVITEIIQNSQRAKAKNLYINLNGDTLTFQDDGCGCGKPENILTLDYSEWESTDEGFGIGLWAWLAIPNASSIELVSRDWRAMMDTETLFNSDIPKAEIEKLEIREEGFRVTIKSSYFEGFESSIRDRIISDMEIQLFDGYLNGEIIPKIDLHENVEGVFKKHFSTNKFIATLAVTRWGSPTLYYENRKVQNLHVGNGVSGTIELRKNTLNLQEPDRKSYVYNEKYYEFEERYNKAVKELYIDFLKGGKQEDVNSLAEQIDNILDISDYERLVFADEEVLELVTEKRNIELSKEYSFEVLKSAIDNINNESQLSMYNSKLSEDEIGYIERLLNDYDNDNKWIETDEIREHEDNSVEITKDIIESNDEIIIGKKLFKKINLEDSLNAFEQDDEEIISKNILSVKKKKEKKKKPLRDIIRSSTRKVWVRASEVESYKDMIAKAEYYKVKVFVAKNILEENVFNHNNVPYISEINTGIQKTNISRDVCIKTDKERYFLELLQPILSYYNLPIDTFKIGYLKLYIETTLDSKVINREVIENTKESIRIYGVTDGRNIILDRRAIGLRRFNLTGSHIGINEFKALMANLKTVSHELAHLLYDTEDNTEKHFKAEDGIYEEIVNLYLSL